MYVIKEYVFHETESWIEINLKFQARKDIRCVRKERIGTKHNFLDQSYLFPEYDRYD